MAGFFGLFDYTKPGKGVDKNGPQKKRFFHFFELYFRKFWKLITLNLIYILFCIPIVTIGPATAAMTYILKNYTMERPVFLWSDFLEAFKKNWKQGFVMGLIDLVVLVLSYVAYQFYFAQLDSSNFFYVPLVLVLSIGFIVALASMYMFIMIPVLDMKFKPMLKNAFLLSIVGIKTNLLTTLFVVLISVLMFLFFPITILLIIPLYFTTVWFIMTYNSFQYVEKYIIDPYYEQIGEKRPDVLDMGDMDEEEFIFEDIGTQEVPVETKTAKKAKTIK
ncbi:YesL family protein [Massiliimalia massiliensis]|jgi:uncharacterized membrane protein YesL|uniref:YesL family protein n=1 Tax=Massiliimalia massiliensis TaxID=1852384 RepID=UPI0009868321|nr:DUF624 domain-containing protein [Massiliimalia massiliensis]